jgi:hypothetical protein
MRTGFCRFHAERSSLGASISATIFAVGKEAREIDPLKQQFSIAIRMMVVLAFLLGMPVAAVPQISEHLRGMRVWQPFEKQVHHDQAGSSSYQRLDGHDLAEPATTVTMLASDRSPPPLAARNPDVMATTIEALKAQFVEAGVSYMILEQVGSESVKYRFQFELPVTAGSAYKRRFQVIDDDPDEAMRLALAELQQWRVADLEPAHLERPTVILR